MLARILGRVFGLRIHSDILRELLH
jgi:hypothetical protein